MRRKSKGGLIILAIIIIIIALFIIFTGFFVSKPLLSQKSSDNYTYWFFRSGTGLPFLSSPESLAIKRYGKSNAVNKVILTQEVLNKIENKKITRLPYIGFFYTLSMIGK